MVPREMLSLVRVSVKPVAVVVNRPLALVTSQFLAVVQR